VELNRLAIPDNAVHEHLNIRKSGDEAVGSIGYPCLRAAVDRDGAGRRVEGRDLSRVVASPSIGISLSELLQCLIVGHVESP
jgi:hypothetical protein